MEQKIKPTLNFKHICSPLVFQQKINKRQVNEYKSKQKYKLTKYNYQVN